jgi:hypothetical protein
MAVSSAVSQARERGWTRFEDEWRHPRYGSVWRDDGYAKGGPWWRSGGSFRPYRTMTEAMDAAEKGAGDGSDK